MAAVLVAKKLGWKLPHSGLLEHPVIIILFFFILTVLVRYFSHLAYVPGD